MSYLLDTNTCIYLLNGRHPELAKKVASLSATEISVSAVVWFELMFGAAKSTRRAEVEQRLRIFARQIDVIPLDLEASEAAAQIRAELEGAGKPIGGYDILIAGHALARGATLVTHNLRELKRVRGLRTADWVVDP